MRGCGLEVEASAERPNAEYTWYKLNEWMQVEVLQEFGAFMEEQPWFRFPFFAHLRGACRPPRRPCSRISNSPLLGCLAAWLLSPPLPPSLAPTRAAPYPPPPTPPTLAPTRLWTVAVYFEVLLREFSIVKQKLGARKAGLSLAFLTDAAQRRETAWPILGASWEGHSSLARAIAL
jgi:hypothetical protein